MKHFLIIVFYIFLAGSALSGQESRSLPDQIAIAYQALDYQETDRLLGIAIAGIDNFSPPERITIWQYAAFREVRKQQPDAARTFFLKLLEIDPNHTLDPVTTSPKIITLFQQTKAEYLENLSDRLKNLTAQPATNIIESHPASWRALLYPGWEQYRRGYKWKGAAWLTIGTTTLAGTVRAILDTRDKRQRYNDATDATSAAERYETYRDAYRSQFYWAYAMGAVWLGAHIDASFFSPVREKVEISLEMTPVFTGIQLDLHW